MNDDEAEEDKNLNEIKSLEDSLFQQREKLVEMRCGLVCARSIFEPLPRLVRHRGKLVADRSRGLVLK